MGNVFLILIETRHIHFRLCRRSHYNKVWTTTL